MEINKSIEPMNHTHNRDRSEESKTFQDSKETSIVREQKDPLKRNLAKLIDSFKTNSNAPLSVETDD